MSNSLFAELKKRNVFRVGTAYLLLAWVLVQITDIAVPALHLPEWIITAVFLFGAIGFPFALVFAWVFEVTPEGIKKESEISPEDSVSAHTGNKLNFIIIGLLILIAGYFIYESRFASRPANFVAGETSTGAELQTEATQKSGNTSIAVLPFVNLSSDPEQEYFSDGISEELLNLLAKIPNLQVAARTSSFQFKGKNQDIQDIAKQLGVKNVLEGSIRKSGTKVRITAQLIKADDGFHMWSETYDRELTDIFKVQDEISAAIVDALKDTLGIELVKQSPRTKSISPEAHDLYLHGLRDLYIYTFDSLIAAVSAFESAIELEPDFLLARIKLAETYQFQIQTGSRFDREILDTADNILKDVIAISPDSAQAHYVRSLIALKKGQRELAKDYIKEAYRLNPNEVNIIIQYAARFGFELGEEIARALFERAAKLDPLNFRVTYWFWVYLMFTLQEHQEAELALKNVNENTTDSLYLSVFSSHYRRTGNLDEALRFNELSALNDPLDPEGPLYASNLYFCLGDGDRALEFAENSLELNSVLGDAVAAKVDALIYLGQEDQALKLVLDTLESPEYLYRRTTKADLVSKGVYLLMKRNQLAEAEALLVEFIPTVVNLTDAPLPKTAEEVTDVLGTELFATVYRAQGKNEQADILAKRLNLLDEDFYTQRQVRLLPGEYQLLAAVSAVQNDDDRTLDYLESLPNGIFPVWWRFKVLHSPIFIHLQDNPRFILLKEAFEAEMTKQLAAHQKQNL